MARKSSLERKWKELAEAAKQEALKSCHTGKSVKI
jgi:hypothetical protein